jgi:RimJ/RimL family protein N-acetyltransferase
MQSTNQPFMCVNEIGFVKLERTDIEAIHRGSNNLYLNTLFYGWGLTYSKEDVANWYASNVQGNGSKIIFGLQHLQSNCLIGTISLYNIDHRNQTASLYVQIFNESYLNKGLGTEATKLMVAYGMYHLNLWNIDLFLYDFNKRAARSYVKAGFREIGRRSECQLINGERYNCLWMEVTRPEFDLDRYLPILYPSAQPIAHEPYSQRSSE